MFELDERLLRGWLVPADIRSRVVYHYTSAAGLIGILSSGVLRGTSAAVQNDPREIADGGDVCLEVLESELGSRGGSERTLIERTIALIRDDMSPHGVYITSFSARRDVLSQWRGYGSAEGRFCIGFQLSQFSERDVLQLPRPVVYVPEDQRALVRRAVSLTCDTLREQPDDSAHAWVCVTSLKFHLRFLMCSFKHPGFDEEQEWRSFALTIGSEDTRFLSFEAVRGLPRPYVTMLAGSRTSTHLPVVEVCIGPTDRRAAAHEVTRLLVDRYGYDNARITATEIPFAP